MVAYEMLYLIFVSPVSTTHRAGINTNSTIEQRNNFTCYNNIQQPWARGNEGNRMHDAWGWEKASLEFKGLLLGFVIDKLIEYGWSVERCTVQWFTDPPKPSGWYREYIEKEQQRGSQPMRTVSRHQIWSNWLVSAFCLCETCLFSNLQLNGWNGRQWNLF